MNRECVENYPHQLQLHHPRRERGFMLYADACTACPDMRRHGPAGIAKGKAHEQKHQIHRNNTKSTLIAPLHVIDCLDSDAQKRIERYKPDTGAQSCAQSARGQRCVSTPPNGKKTWRNSRGGKTFRPGDRRQKKKDNR